MQVMWNTCNVFFGAIGEAGGKWNGTSSNGYGIFLTKHDDEPAFFSSNNQKLARSGGTSTSTSIFDFRVIFISPTQWLARFPLPQKKHKGQDIWARFFYY